MSEIWQWEEQSRWYGNYGNANQWTVNVGLSSLGREGAKTGDDARAEGRPSSDPWLPPRIQLALMLADLVDGRSRE
jgi:hypothetical protein